MYKKEFLAERVLNPYSVYAIGPFEEMKYRNMDFVIMPYLYGLLPERKKETRSQKPNRKSNSLVQSWIYF